MNKYFSLPGYCNNFLMVKLFIEYRDAHPELFIEDHIVESLYDFPSSLIWGGGRTFNTNISYEQLEEAMHWCRDRKIQLRHVCTNMLLTEEHLHDVPCNTFFQVFGEPEDKVIIYSSLLKDYLTKAYPELTYVYSTTLGITDIDKINDITKDNIYVLNYNKNNDNEYLKQLQYPNNIEIICGELCVGNCSYRAKHYEIVSKMQLDIPLDPTDNVACIMNPPYKNAEQIFDLAMSMPHAITLERINELAQMGFNHFKISGRNMFAPGWFRLVCYYLVKPEYLETVYLDLRTQYIKELARRNAQ